MILNVLSKSKKMGFSNKCIKTKTNEFLFLLMKKLLFLQKFFKYEFTNKK